jgi:hypothetical protein
MGVEHEANRLGRQGLDGRRDLVGERRVLVVDQEDPVVPDEHADVAARPLEHRDAAGDGDGLDLDLREVLLGERRGCQEAACKHERGKSTSHFGLQTKS